jgi:hypothetical protein
MLGVVDDKPRFVDGRKTLPSTNSQVFNRRFLDLLTMLTIFRRVPVPSTDPSARRRDGGGEIVKSRKQRIFVELL